MKLLKTKISGLKLVKTNIYKDKRGLLKEIYRKEILKKPKKRWLVISKATKLPHSILLIKAMIWMIF